MRRSEAVEYIRSGKAAQDLQTTNLEPRRFSLVVGRHQLPFAWPQESIPLDHHWHVLAINNASIREAATEDTANAYFMRPGDRGSYGNVHQGHNAAYGLTNNIWLWNTD